LGVGIALIVLIAGVYFVLSEPVARPTPIETNNTATSSLTITATTTEEGELDDIELDLSKLQGKDRLYTEEEGKYENLSEEERRLLTEAYHCKDQRGNGLWACKKYASIYLDPNDYLKNVRLVSLLDGVAVIHTVGEGQPKGRLYIYDLVERETIDEFIDYGNFALGPKYIVNKETLSENTQKLKLYRPGMRNFVDIPESIARGVDYLDSSEPMLREFPIEFTNDSITVFLHTYKNCVDIGGEFAPGLMQCEVASIQHKEFDLTNLP